MDAVDARLAIVVSAGVVAAGSLPIAKLGVPATIAEAATPAATGRGRDAVAS